MRQIAPNTGSCNERRTLHVMTELMLRRLACELVRWFDQRECRPVLMPRRPGTILSTRNPRLYARVRGDIESRAINVIEVV